MLLHIALNFNIVKSNEDIEPQINAEILPEGEPAQNLAEETEPKIDEPKE